MKRLAVYVFWEKKGIVREYVKRYVKGLQQIAEKVIVVVNGDIQEQGRSELQQMGIEVLQRENEGVDFWAYKCGMDHETGYADKYDAVVLANCSCYGPVYPFEEMFEEMDSRGLDFWGISEWPENESGYVGTWVLSYFMVFHKRMIQSEEWKEYWANLCEVHSRDECIEKHETKFTPYFSERGFQYGVYCPNSPDYIDMTIEAPDYMVMKQRCPVIKRKAFCAEYNRFLTYHRGNSARAVWRYLEQEKLYDTNIILDDLLATQHYDAVKNCLHLNYILSADKVQKELCTIPKTVVCFHMYYEELLEDCVTYLESVPEFADIYITTPKPELVEVIREMTQRHGLKNVRIECISARGRAEAAFLVATKDFIMDYDLACIVHDKKSSFLRPGIIGKEFGWHNQDALLKSREYVLNLLKIFEDNPRMGILEPFNLLYASYRELYGREWGENYEGTVKFLEENGIDLPIAPDVPPAAPMGAMFWFRPQCMAGLLEKSWEYEDFPEEPLPLDGSLIHIIERAYPFFCQDKGYLIGWVAAEEDAAVYTTDIAYLYRNARIELMQRETQIHERDLRIQELEAQANRELNKHDMASYLKTKVKKYLHIK